MNAQEHHAIVTLQIFVDWLQQTAMGKQNTLRLDPDDKARERGHDIDEDDSREDGRGKGDDAASGAHDEGIGSYTDEDTPLTWAEVNRRTELCLFLILFRWVPSET